MESELSADKEIPPVPIKTYQWEDLRRARDAGAYPWTHFLKPPLEGEVTAEDVLRESTPRRSMSREFSRSRTHSPVGDEQRILNLDASPGSSRKHGEEGEDEGVQVPNFSKEVSLDSDEDANQAAKASAEQSATFLSAPLQVPIKASPKSILKRPSPEPHYIGVTETREKTRCCHPLVNKIKHLADKTIQKFEEKSPLLKRKKDEQEIRNLKSSPGAVRRQKFSAIKLGDSDEMSKTMSVDASPPERKKKEHIYEDIEETKNQGEKVLHFAPDTEEHLVEKYDDENLINKDTESMLEKKSNASQDPSLVSDESCDLKPEEHIMETLHKVNDTAKEALVLDEEAEDEEPNVDEVYQNQLDESENITITEIIDDNDMSQDNLLTHGESSTLASEGNVKGASENAENWSKINSDHEYEIIGKPLPNIVYTAPSVEEKMKTTKSDEELSSSTSLEKRNLQRDDDDNFIKVNEEDDDVALQVEALQRDIEDRYFANTPSPVSRTECEVSTSQVDSSALENLPLKRENRSKNNEATDSKIQQRIREGTGKLKFQAGKLKTKLQNIKAKQFIPDKPKISFPDRPKFKMPERPKISLPERPKFTLPDRRKFSLPERAKFKKLNFSQKLHDSDRKKFSFPDRPKFSVPDLPKFKLPDRPKINFSSLGRKKESKVEETATVSATNQGNVAAVEFESKTYPRLFSRKKKSAALATSTPSLNREDTPPPVFTFTRVKKAQDTQHAHIPDNPEEPREYGSNLPYDLSHEVTINDFDEPCDVDESTHAELDMATASNVLPSDQEYTNVINEINHDEFFLRPRGISRENIQVREYLSDEIRQAFKIPKNSLAMMESPSRDEELMHYENDDADPELMLDDNEPFRYSNEDLDDRDDGYYTFPPVRPSRAKKKKKEIEAVQYIDENIDNSMHFSEVDLDVHDFKEQEIDQQAVFPDVENDFSDQLDYNEPLRNEYLDEEEVQNPTSSQTLPMPPSRKKRNSKIDIRHSSLSDFENIQASSEWYRAPVEVDDIIVYRTEHEYVVSQTEPLETEQSPVAPRRVRNRSRSSRGTSLCDDDRTSRGAESLTLDTNMPQPEAEVALREESPGYATVEKRPKSPTKSTRRSKSKTPPPRPRRKSSSPDRKYYTVGPTRPLPDRPPRKKSSTSLMTLDSVTRKSSGDVTQYVEIDDFQQPEAHKDLISGEIINKMKDRPLPPPPRPPRGSRSKQDDTKRSEINLQSHESLVDEIQVINDVVEMEVSTQTDPLPDDVDYELGIEENLDFSMSSSLKDINDDHVSNKSLTRLGESTSRPASRSEKSLKLSDPKISEISRSPLGRTSPTVILVERRVSSPTRINEREEMLTEASLTVQHIDVEESKVPEVPPLPASRGKTSKMKSASHSSADERALERIERDSTRDVQLDNLITKRLQVSDLDVGRLNVSELQASKILVSDIEGMTLQVTELDSKSGHISVSGIEFSQNVIDEIVKKFSELSTTLPSPQQHVVNETVKTQSREEETQTDEAVTTANGEAPATKCENMSTPPPTPQPVHFEDAAVPPQRPPPPDLTPLLYSYLQDVSLPAASLYHVRPPRERPFTEFHESQHQFPPPPTRRVKRRPTTPHTESSSENDGKPRPSPRRAPPPVRAHEPSVTEAGAQFLRACHSSISRTVTNIFHHFMSYISGSEDKRDIQMALVIFLVLIAGLIMFGLSDSRTVHHHHWEFFNPPDSKP